MITSASNSNSSKDSFLEMSVDDSSTNFSGFGANFSMKRPFPLEEDSTTEAAASAKQKHFDEEDEEEPLEGVESSSLQPSTGESILTAEESEHLESMIEFRAAMQKALFRQLEAKIAFEKRASLIEFLEKQIAQKPDQVCSFYSSEACGTMLREMREQQEIAAKLEASFLKEEKEAEKEEPVPTFTHESNASFIEATNETSSSSLDDVVHVRIAQSMEDIRAAWMRIAKKDSVKCQRLLREFVGTKMAIQKKLASFVQREALRWQSKSIPTTKELVVRSKRIAKEVSSFWKKNEKEEKESRKRAEKEELERRKREEEQREASRQSKKLNFLITQTELYTHFVLKKSASSVAESEADSPVAASQQATLLASSKEFIDFDAEDEESLTQKARSKALIAASARKAHTRLFDEMTSSSAKHHQQHQQKSTTDGNFSVEKENSESSMTTTTVDVQPSLLKCTLKGYQLKGLNWLASLYEQGINGILADEMGLGKTIQSISLMAYLAEKHSLWGPFLVITPASTLHNWQQEITKFTPSLRVLPYWGSVSDRATLRKYWNVKLLGQQDAPFHILVTSYQLVVADEKHFKRIKWQYMILDEAQAIKSSSSNRWKTLLSINCRNRLLLTGTPIQNTMQELWALLHFIMPGLFDSHEEFSEWFSKDIESHAASDQQTRMNETQLARLHMILKPFMLRRTKKEVESELAPKVEIDQICELSPMQARMYTKIKGKSSIDEILDRVVDFHNSSGGGGSGSKNSILTANEKTLMNLVMQLRKVSNHPELFERQDVRSPFFFEPSIELSFPKQALIESSKTLSDIARHVKDEVYSSLKTNDHLLVSMAKEGILEQRNDALQPEFSPAFFQHSSPFQPAYLAVLPRLPRFHFPSAIAKSPRLCVSSFEFSFCHRQQRQRQQFSLIGSSSTSSSFNSPFLLHHHHQNSNYHLPRSFCCNDSLIQIPDSEDLIRKSGKLQVLQRLLRSLKAEGHRVLIYFQMTKMIDLAEEFLTHEGYLYRRLDGSCKIADRRDMVADFQNNPEIFVFLLSTRAGGLGINLTAADTVIFYDSDWNPTVDQQAMDRAHRLGQTKQVTVYRLITRDTVEERILQRAKQKGQIHRLVVEQQ